MQVGTAASGFSAALVAGDATTAEAHARTLTSDGLSLLALYELMTETLERVGECWERGEMTVAQEHRATAAAAQVVARLRGAPPGAVRGSVLLTTLPGERHTFGIAVLEHLLETARFRAVAVGDVPVGDAVETARALPSLRAVLVSAHLAPDDSALRVAIRQLRAAAPEASVIVGGPAFAHPDAGRSPRGAHAVRLTARDALAAVDDAAGPLTRREAEVLEHLAAGLTNNDIAKELALSSETVKGYVDSIMTKLGARSRTAAVSSAFRAGLLS